MKHLRILFCSIMIAFMLFTPRALANGAQQSFEDMRFVQKDGQYRGAITIYHIVRHRPYSGSLSNWLQKRADEYEKQHRGSFITVEGMDEDTFIERLEHGRRADAYSFFSGSVYRDLLSVVQKRELPYRQGLFQTDRCIPYCYSGYVRLERNDGSTSKKAYYEDEILAARMDAGIRNAQETEADTLYLDLRKAGDLIRYKDDFMQSALYPIDNFTDAVCWLGIDRDTDQEKSKAIQSFFDWLLEQKQQQKLNALGLFSVRSDVHDAAPESQLKQVFRIYETVETVDPFLWYEAYDSLYQDAVYANGGDEDAKTRFRNRMKELKR